MGGRGDMRRDALEVADDVEMQGAGLDPLGPPVAQTAQMALRRRLLHVANTHLSLQQRARRALVAGHEHPNGEAQIARQALMHRDDFIKTLGGEAEPVLDLGRDFAKTLVENVANMLKIDGEGEYVGASLRVAFLERFIAADLRQVTA